MKVILVVKWLLAFRLLLSVSLIPWSHHLMKIISIFNDKIMAVHKRHGMYPLGFALRKSLVVVGGETKTYISISELQ